MESSKNKFLIITGLSGAGKSQVVHALEDIGFFCVDNLPPALISKFAELCVNTGSKIKNIALVIDSRGREFFKTLPVALKELREEDVTYELLFLEASAETLIRRYKETRRRHPLAHDGLLSEGIKKEIRSLELIRNQADHVIDTSRLKPAELRQKITELYSKDEKNPTMNVNVLSFGFKHGIPLEADLVFDVRFLPNPFYLPELKHKSGQQQEVIDYITSFEETHEFLEKLTDLLEFLLPKYQKEGKSQQVIAIGCTGGMHRSVFIADTLRRICAQMGFTTSVVHRDLEKNR